jgi:hypothetical protein
VWVDQKNPLYMDKDEFFDPQVYSGGSNVECMNAELCVGLSTVEQ